MSDQPTANIEDSDVWHDANSYYGDEMTDVSAARERAERALRLAWARGNPVARYAEEATKSLARDVVALADRVEAAKERDEAHLALDNFNVPREEPHAGFPQHRDAAKQGDEVTSKQYVDPTPLEVARDLGNRVEVVRAALLRAASGELQTRSTIYGALAALDAIADKLRPTDGGCHVS